MEDADFARFLWNAGERYAWLPPEMLLRLARAYGTRVDMLLGNARSLGDLGLHFGGDLYQREVEYLIAHEFAQCPQDVLWRRSKLGLHLAQDAQDALASWFATRN